MFNAFVRWVDPAGRARRRDLLAFAMIALPTVILADAGTFRAVLLLALSLPALTLVVRRLHDTGRGGLSMLAALVPVFGWLLLARWLACPGMRGANDYGVDPRGARRRAAGQVATGGWPVFH